MFKNILIILGILSINVAHPSTISNQDFAKLFNNSNACFILYDIETHQTVLEYNPNNRCNERIPPNSSFKIPLSLMAFDQGIISESTVFTWNGEKYWMPDWNQNQTPLTWEKYSVVWVSRLLTAQLGMTKIKDYLAKFKYGNQDFSGDPGKHNGLTNAWLSSSLKVSAIEQMYFLDAMYQHTLSIRNYAMDITKHNIYLGKLDSGFDYYGKTGSGFKQNGKDIIRNGWFVGYVESDTNHYIFVTNLTDKNKNLPKDQFIKGGAMAKAATLSILNTYFQKQ